MASCLPQEQPANLNPTLASTQPCSKFGILNSSQPHPVSVAFLLPQFHPKNPKALTSFQFRPLFRAFLLLQFHPLLEAQMPMLFKRASTIRGVSPVHLSWPFHKTCTTKSHNQTLRLNQFPIICICYLSILEIMSKPFFSI